MWKLLLLSAIGVALLFGYFNNAKASSKGQLKSFRYNWSNPDKAGCEEVFLAEEDGIEYVKLTIKSFDNEGHRFVHTGRVKREEFMQGLERLSEKRGLDKWNGFSQSAPAKLGNSFKLEANYSNGQHITAEGNNSVPDGYGPAVKEIKDYFKAQCK